VIRIFRLLALTLTGVIVIAIAVANRQTVTVILNPLSAPDDALSLQGPLFVFLFAALLVGFILGGLAAWLGQGKWRKLARLRTKETFMLRREQDRLLRDLKAAQMPTAEATARELPQLASR
jgi:hypothetical protein